MARKPVKKLKRKPRKRIPSVFGAEEAKIFDIPKPPRGIAYQWVLIDHKERWSDAWVQVPFDRHAHEMPKKTNVDGYIVYLDNILVQRDKQLVDIEQSNYQDAAIKQFKDYLAYSQQWRNDSVGPFSFPILSEQFIASSSYERVTGPPVVLDITVPVRMSAHLQDTASALGLTAQEYLQRSISLYVKGETDGLLLPIDGAMELHQIYLNNDSRKN